MNSIAQQIDARMKAHGLTYGELETKAHVKPHAVRNIVMGKSKRPGAITLQAIADALGCNSKDLLATPSFLQEEISPRSLEILFKNVSVKSILMGECVKVIEDSLQKIQNTVTAAQFLIAVREVYLHSFQRDSLQVNKDFAEWFCSLMCEEIK